MGVEASEFIMTPPYVDTERLTGAGGKTPDENQHNWEVLRDTIIGAGGTVINHVVGQVFPTQVYDRDAALIIGKQAVVPDPKKLKEALLVVHGYDQKERTAVVEGTHAFLKNHGLELKTLSGFTFEGGDTVVSEKNNTIFMGMNFYNMGQEEKAVQAMSAATGMKVVPVPMPQAKPRVITLSELASLKPTDTHPPYYHLDTYMSVLPNGEVLINPKGTTAEGLALIKNTVGEKNIILVNNEHDQLGYAANLVNVGNTLIMPTASKELRKTLEDRGYRVITPEDQGLKPGAWNFNDGAVHCVTLPVYNAPRQNQLQTRGDLRGYQASTMPEKPNDVRPSAAAPPPTTTPAHSAPSGNKKPTASSQPALRT